MLVYIKKQSYTARIFALKIQQRNALKEILMAMAKHTCIIGHDIYKYVCSVMQLLSSSLQIQVHAKFLESP